MIDAAKAKHLRDQAVRPVCSQGRVTPITEIKGSEWRNFKFERGRLLIDYGAPRYPGAPLPKITTPSAYESLVRFDGAKLLSLGRAKSDLIARKRQTTAANDLSKLNHRSSRSLSLFFRLGNCPNFMAFHDARSFHDKVETCRSLARHTANATLRVLQLLIEEYSAKKLQRASKRLHLGAQPATRHANCR
jgi:hypothetical protein